MLSHEKVLSKTGLVALCGLIAIPFMWPKMAAIEGRYWPVVTTIKVVSEELFEDTVGKGVKLVVDFEKLRQCEFIGLNWYDVGERRIAIDFGGIPKKARSRPPGKQNHAGPWKLYGINTIQGTHASTLHKCHPLWLTHTKFYVTGVGDEIIRNP